MVPDEREEVAPILDSESFEAAMAFHKSLEHPMDFVDRVHRILFVRQAFGHLGLIDCSLHIEFSQSSREEN